ncbi:MAG: pantoate--beta-alanine ligase [Arthrobacter sp.]|uniref:pantoate--beta-alanine ligase n=1 Tax=unclassified Arthrobacter TaxID=235627 RepID=UPI002652AD72|nr:pantoate--beta-alanine ligase [Micrococcaceae bacterium]MDN5825201.1 pantoate--beta-alanine ligase [Micrococcaceae bacterium]MDN5879797.1 pantoate--beta-alanine ligase [Micrococcaceae bacterium]MDN5904436.1 pantoate--beta-alanine ligase [Micrococcaceae bacterium]MDN6170195.1 pantoate--beta-alanine ligase [Micrococcaceae bacterium]
MNTTAPPPGDAGALGATRPLLVRTAAELAALGSRLLAQAPATDGPRRLGLVPTMGALHAGHEHLVSAARAENDVVVVSVFVNRLQFDDPADFERYPRDLEADRALLASAGADIVFAPEEPEIYPGGAPLVRLSSGTLGEKFEGASRPGHFDGMLAVVAKLLHIAQPSSLTPVPVEYSAYFGQKDAQQLAIVRRLVTDLSYPVRIRAVPIVRSAEGLALSSRNQFLTPEQADAALVLSRALFLLADRAAAHEALMIDEAEDLIGSQPLVELDYLEVVDPDTLEPLAFNCRETPFTGGALVLVAARTGQVRLIDNMLLGDAAD